MPRYVHKSAVYPQVQNEYHVVTPTGVCSGIFDTAAKAYDYLDRIDHPNWKVILVVTTKELVDRPVAPKTGILHAMAEELGCDIHDIKLSIPV